jgi:molybdate transport system regulatory protein
MKTSARNEFNGQITEIISGEVMSEIKVNINADFKISAIITNEGKEAMELDKGKDITALIKSSVIVLSKEKIKATARNIIEGKVIEIIKGQVNSEVKLAVQNNTIYSVITNDAVDDLGLKVGDTAYAIFKASTVILVS